MKDFHISINMLNENIMSKLSIKQKAKHATQTTLPSNMPFSWERQLFSTASVAVSFSLLIVVWERERGVEIQHDKAMRCDMIYLYININI